MTTPGPPPSRYRIIERDRRLVVIDTWDGSQPGDRIGMPLERQAGSGTSKPVGPPSGRATLFLGPYPTAFDGRAEFLTHAIYDKKAPRTLMLDPGSARLVSRIRLVLVGVAMIAVIGLIWNILLAMPLMLLFNDNVRGWLRDRSTAWIDRLQDRLG
ncbi:MAG: hypothetical protein WC816_11670 [Sphingomonas sp.]|jgi:hypothetical protein